MADTKKSIQVNIDVVVNQAKKAMSDMANATQKTADSFEKMGVSAKRATDEIQKTTEGATKASGGFLNMAKGVFVGQAAYDMFKKAVGGAVDFMRDSINESIDAAATMARVKTNVENAGFAFKDIAPQLDAYSQKMIQLGFDDEATSESVSKLLGITHNYSQAIKLNQLAMDLARNKSVSLEQATTSIAQVMQGAGAKALLQYGLSFKDGASAAEVLYQLQEKVKNSAEGFAGTTAGKLETFKNQWANIKQEVGDKLSPALDIMIKAFQDNMPTIISMVSTLANGLASVVGWVGKMGGNELNEYSSNVETAVEATNKYYVELAKAKNGQSDLSTEQLKAAINTAELGRKITELTEKQKILNKYLEDGKLTRKEIKNLEAIGVDGIQSWNIWTGAVKNANKALNEIGGQLDSTKKQFEENKDGTSAVDKELEKLNSTTKKTKDGFDGIKGAIGGDATAVIEAHKQAVKELASAFNDVKNKQDEFTFNSATDFDKFGKLIANTKMAQDQWITATKQGFSAYSSAIKAVDSDMESLKKKIEDAKKSLADFTTSSTQSAGQQFAQIVFDAKKAVQELPQKISEAQAGGQDTKDLQKQLDDANAVLEESNKAQYNSQNDKNSAMYQLSVEYHSALDILERQANQNSLQNAFETLQKKILDKQKETETVIAEIQKQIDADQDQKNKYLTAQDAMTKAYGEAVKIRQKSSNTEIASLTDLTSAVNAARDAYIAMANAALRARGATGGSSPVSTSNTGHASGGLVNPGQTYVVGENGPELFTSKRSGEIIPNGKMGATNNVNITINNPNMRSDDDVKMLASEIMRILARSDELARFGSYK